MVAKYRHPLLAQLAHQFHYTPRPRRLEHLERIREFAASIQPDKSYPYDYVCYQITRFRPDDTPSVSFPYEDLLADLMAMLHELSETLDLTTADAGEPVFTLDEVRRTYDVSLKTVRRWRARGLVAMRYEFPDGRRLTGILQSDLQSFVEANPQTVERTGAYSYIDARTRREVLARAFELSLRESLSLDEAVGRLAREHSSSHDTIRDLLETYDREHPETPIFPRDGDPLSSEERRKLLALYRAGYQPGELARTFLRDKSAMDRAVREVVVDEILGQEWEYMPCEGFDAPDAEATLLADLEPEGLDEMGMAGPLDVEQERRLFTQYNFLKYLLAEAREELTPSELVPEQLDRLVRLHDAAMSIRNCLVVANLRLVVHLAARHIQVGRPLDGLVSDGTVSLMQAIEKFDCTRGVRFSTYASWAIRKNFAKSIPREYEIRRAAATGAQELLDEHPDPNTVSAGERELGHVLHSTVATLLLELSPREREVVIARFGIGKEAETLEQIGNRFSVSRERIRQIEARALRKLADIVDPALLQELV